MPSRLGTALIGSSARAATKKKVVRKARKGERIRQVAAIPFRLGERGDVEVMLVTSISTRRFIVPKGWPMKGKNGRKAATIEALEEAGVLGKTLKQPAGTYSYWKRPTGMKPKGGSGHGWRRKTQPCSSTSPIFQHC